MTLIRRTVKRRRRMAKRRCRSYCLAKLLGHKRQQYVPNVSNLPHRTCAMLVPQSPHTLWRRYNIIELKTTYHYSVNFLHHFENRFAGKSRKPQERREILPQLQQLQQLEHTNRAQQAECRSRCVMFQIQAMHRQVFRRVLERHFINWKGHSSMKAWTHGDHCTAS